VETTVRRGRASSMLVGRPPGSMMAISVTGESVTTAAARTGASATVDSETALSQTRQTLSKP
jgi:hypothetical protein